MAFFMPIEIMRNKGNEWRNYLLIAAIGVLFFIPYLGRVHLFDWDEINFAEAAREMIVTGDYMTVRVDYEPFHEKPPLFFWMQAASMHIFGINEFGARFPNALIGIITLMVLYAIGKKLFDFRLGILWVLAYAGSILPYFYFRTGIIDPLFNLLMFLGVYFISEYFYQVIYFEQAAKYRHKCIIIAGLFVSMAIMTKGPVGYLLPTLCWIIVWLMHRKRARIPVKSFLVFTLIAAVPVVVWYYFIMSSSNDGNIVKQFVDYQIRLMTTRDAGHGGPFYYHFVVLLIGCFPASVVMVKGLLARVEDSSYQQNFRIWMIILLCVVLLIFSIVETKIIHYSSLTYFPITFLAAYAMYCIIYGRTNWKAGMNWFLGIMGTAWALLLAAVPLLLINRDMILPRIRDEFTRAILMADVQWSGYEPLIGVIYLASVIAAIVFLARHRYLKGFLTVFGGTAIVLSLFLPFIVPKIDSYMQESTIEFYSRLKHCGCYVQPVGFKSYAHYFYSEREPYQSPYIRKIPRDDYEKWLLTGDIDRPAYFVCKNTSVRSFLVYPGVKFLYSRNGWVFMKRERVEAM